ncbi:hypothetical protein Glove_320g192 [Diversispora epigaea]|uniref:Uncharacterized protein n=1 Tax=Diversispora epigaea TaxID=1348612 RepID=A0A397HNQ6_9GLOM|nr:hypothetical protein Glove_320g192 [Diversispora epigaea]
MLFLIYKWPVRFNVITKIMRFALKTINDSNYNINNSNEDNNNNQQQQDRKSKIYELIQLLKDEPEIRIDLEPKSYSFIEQVSMLIKVLYIQCGNIELNLIHFQQIIVEFDPRLQKFFNKMEKALIPDKRSFYNKIGAKKNNSSHTAIDTLNSIGLSACYTTSNIFKQKLAYEHPLKIREFFSEQNNYLYVYNLDNYYNIHEKRRPNITALSTAKHMATYICKQVSACAPVPIIFNGSSIHNPVNIDANDSVNVTAVVIVGEFEIMI